MIEFIIPLIGRFHPLIVHLPIGFILFALLMLFYPKKNNTIFYPVLEFALWWSTVTAILACISGFLLYTSEGYAFATVRNHLILGLLTAAICGLLYFQLRKKQTLNHPLIKGLSFVLLLSILVTGHLGGSLTHGEEYLTEVLPEGIQRTFGWYSEEEIAQISLDETNWQEAKFYDQVIHPILQNNCRSCHNPNNIKGDLVLTSRETLLIGGKNGKIIQSNQPEESHLFQRITLPLDHEDHMPPKEKKQPKKEEVELLKAWLVSGSSFESTLGQAGIPEELVSPFFIRTLTSIYPEVDLIAVSDQVLSKIKEHGFFIEPLSLRSSLLRVSCINFPSFSNEDMNILEPVYAHIAALDLGNTQIDDNLLDSISKLENLVILNLQGTAVIGNSLGKLHPLKNLVQLNLTHTQTTLSNLKKLNAHPRLEKIFAFASPAAKERASKENIEFSFIVEFGNFELPVLASGEKVY